MLNHIFIQQICKDENPKNYFNFLGIYKRFCNICFEINKSRRIKYKNGDLNDWSSENWLVYLAADVNKCRMFPATHQARFYYSWSEIIQAKINK